MSLPIGNAIAAAATILASAGVVIAWILSTQKKHEDRLNLLRNAMERGQSLDADLVNKVAPLSYTSSRAMNRKPLSAGQGLRVAGAIVIAFGIGFAVFGGFISLVDDRALFPMVGVGALFCCVGMGLFAASKFIRSESDAADIQA